MMRSKPIKDVEPAMKKQYEETCYSSVVIFVYRNPLPLEAIQNVTTNCRLAEA
jgi:hypothetical protein